jgi:hypothetical protein
MAGVFVLELGQLPRRPMRVGGDVFERLYAGLVVGADAVDHLLGERFGISIEIKNRLAARLEFRRAVLSGGDQYLLRCGLTAPLRRILPMLETLIAPTIFCSMTASWALPDSLGRRTVRRSPAARRRS